MRPKIRGTDHSSGRGRFGPALQESIFEAFETFIVALLSKIAYERRFGFVEIRVKRKDKINRAGLVHRRVWI